MREKELNYAIANNVKGSSKAALIAAIIGGKESHLDLAWRVLDSVGHCLNQIAEKSHRQLRELGFTEAQAIKLRAAFQLGLELCSEKVLKLEAIASSKDAFNAILPQLHGLSHEEFWVLILNRANKVLGRERISIGGLAGTVVDSKKLYQAVLKYPKVNAIILAHNHPSGNLSPSGADIDVTKKLIEAGKLLDIKVLDHIIVGVNEYSSLADEGYM